MLAAVLLGSKGDPGCISFAPNTYQTALLVKFFDMLAGIEVSFRMDEQRTDGGRMEAEGQTEVEVEIVI